MFTERASLDQVKMIEIKLSQGAKPGQGGLLPGAKVTPAIAKTRGVPLGKDVHSPPRHTAFSTPVGMMDWIAELRELSGGKSIGFKLCIGHRWEFLALVKAMLQTGITPDFIVIDGAEGGTGAAPAELSNRVGKPLREGLIFVVNALTGAGLRDRIRFGVAGKIVDGHDRAANLALGADWCKAARTFMFSIGCVQTKKCHNDHCPTGVATQDPWREAGLVVENKGPLAFNFHRNRSGRSRSMSALRAREPLAAEATSSARAHGRQSGAFGGLHLRLPRRRRASHRTGRDDLWSLVGDGRSAKLCSRRVTNSIPREPAVDQMRILCPDEFAVPLIPNVDRPALRPFANLVCSMRVGVEERVDFLRGTGAGFLAGQHPCDGFFDNRHGLRPFK